jgi:hypothetical protein
MLAPWGRPPVPLPGRWHLDLPLGSCGCSRLSSFRPARVSRSGIRFRNEEMGEARREPDSARYESYRPQAEGTSAGGGTVSLWSRSTIWRVSGSSAGANLPVRAGREGREKSARATSGWTWYTFAGKRFLAKPAHFARALHRLRLKTVAGGMCAPEQLDNDCSKPIYLWRTSNGIQGESPPLQVTHVRSSPSVNR